jgi:hypothetical protein
MDYNPPIGAAADASYVDGNPALGIEGSPVPAAALEHPQREIVAVIEAAGLSPDGADLTQLHQAITVLITAAAPNLDGVALLGAAQSFTKAQRSTPVAIDDAAPAMDMDAGNVFAWTLAGNRTLPAPTNLTPGQSGCIWLTQDGVGGRTLAFNAVWQFGGGTLPTLSTAAGAVDLLVYEVNPAGTAIAAALVKGIA